MRILSGISFLLMLAILAPSPLDLARAAGEVVHLPMISNLKTGPYLSGCPMLPGDNIWNTPIDSLPADPLKTSTYINKIGAGLGFKADFGSGDWPEGSGVRIGIPYDVVTITQPKLPVDFLWPDESDAGPYPIPANASIEGDPNRDDDRHVLLLNQDECILYELYHTYPPDAGGNWSASSGAIFDLRSNALRPATWTSADAAGLPILPGLVRYDEVNSGSINHAIRFTVPDTQKNYVWPARHAACTTCSPSAPPMGQRFRLKASFNISGFPTPVQVILKAMQRYGIIVADNGSAWYLSGVPDPRWDNDMLRQLADVHGSDMEAVDTTSLIISPNSGQARQP